MRGDRDRRRRRSARRRRRCGTGSRARRRARPSRASDTTTGRDAPAARRRPSSGRSASTSGAVASSVNAPFDRDAGVAPGVLRAQRPCVGAVPDGVPEASRRFQANRDMSPDSVCDRTTVPAPVPDLERRRDGLGEARRDDERIADPVGVRREEGTAPVERPGDGRASSRAGRGPFARTKPSTDVPRRVTAKIRVPSAAGAASRVIRRRVPGGRSWRPSPTGPAPRACDPNRPTPPAATTSAAPGTAKSAGSIQVGAGGLPRDGTRPAARGRRRSSDRSPTAPPCRDPSRTRGRACAGTRTGPAGGRARPATSGTPGPSSGSW